MRKLVIVLVVLLALGVVADRAAAYVAEGVVAQKIADSEGIEDADVDITGFPFLTQVARGEFSAIEVRIPSVEAAAGDGQVRVDGLEATFRDVRTSDGFSAATAGSLTGSGVIPYDAFTGVSRVRVGYGGSSPDGEGLLRVTLPGRSVAVLVQPSMLDGTTLGFTGADDTTRIDVEGLPGALGGFVIDRYPLAGLPDGFTIEKIDVTREGLDLTVTGTDVPLA